MKAFCATSRDKDSDGALVTDAKRGDTRAFEQLVSRHERRALATAQRITRNREDAEDVVQESFLKAFRHLAGFEEKARFSSWLTRIVMNEAYMLLRQKRRVMEVLPDSPQDSTESTPDPFVDRSPSPEESCWRHERKELLTKEVNRLRPTIRRAVLLRDFEERSLEETAQTLHTSSGAVKTRLFHARRKLREMVNPELLRDFSLSRGPRHNTVET
jgi:RNA polymerase sigma-70 factor (ECF subfamily)